MNATSGALAGRLQKALDSANISVETLAERTKVPRSTILHLMGEPVSAILPEPVYLRGHLALLAVELGIGSQELVTLYDAENPMQDTRTDYGPSESFRRNTFAVGATLGGVALIAVVLAFASVLNGP